MKYIGPLDSLALYKESCAAEHYRFGYTDEYALNGTEMDVDTVLPSAPCRMMMG